MYKYQLIDSGEGKKLEQFGPYRLIRPCPQALWDKKDPDSWTGANAEFSKKGWTFARKLPKKWSCQLDGIQLEVAPTDFGSVGLLPEHMPLWRGLRPLAKGANILNLFGGAGDGTIAFAQEGASICHLDLVKGLIDCARGNAALNELSEAPVRWILDDALKFLRREGRREAAYDAIFLDPPTFAQSGKGEVFKIEEDLLPLLKLCKPLLSKEKRFVAIACHTPSLTPICLQNIASGLFPEAEIEAGEMAIEQESANSIPQGSFVKIVWKK